jgi:Globin
MINCVFIEFLRRFFKAHPDYQLKFKSFASVPLDQLKDNPRVQAHALNVMYTVTLLVDSLDDVACLVEQLKTLGANHQRRTIELSHFEVSGAIF